MIYINHRVNTIEQLHEVPLLNGIEVDVRYHNDKLVLDHDPLKHHLSSLETLESLLSNWKHKGPIILNVKTEGIEDECIKLMTQYNINSWFFLDLSMPYFVKYACYKSEINGFSNENLAVRFSEHEPIEYALSFAGKAKWVWVDCFTQLPLNIENYNKLKNAGFNICLVSPELQQHDVAQINIFKNQIKDMNIDAICTKYPKIWES